METVVLYTSHYGATKQYATALAAALGAPCFAWAQRTRRPCAAQGALCTAAACSGRRGRPWQGEKIFPRQGCFLFTVGLAAAQRPEVRAEIEGQVRRGLGQQSLAPGHLFCLRGAFALTNWVQCTKP